MRFSDGSRVSLRRVVRQATRRAGLNMDISRRKELLQGMTLRAEAVDALLKKEFTTNPNTRAILFHESITEVMKIFFRLREHGYRVIAEHSRLPDSTREEGLSLFREGLAQVIVSARSLVEGFNVPAVDVGIIVASSGSVRQRIQSLGRVLRRHRGLDGEEKTSVVHVLYARDTVDDRIYERLDWDRTTGVQQNVYYTWNPGNQPERQEGPPRRPLPDESEVDASRLRQGEQYPGRYEGIDYTCDTRGNVQNSAGEYASNPGGLVDDIRRIKEKGGRFRVTPRRGYVLVRVPQGDEWVTVFVRCLTAPLRFGTAMSQQNKETLDLKGWVATATPGDQYPRDDIPIKSADIVFRKKRGGVLARRVKNGEVFARVGARAEDPSKGAATERLLLAIHQVRRSGGEPSKLEINELDHVLYREKGRLVFICALETDLEFPN